MKKRLLPAILIFCSCGPIYHTSYSYTPPGNLRGNECANNCQSVQQDCEQDEKETYRDCQSQAELQYALCQASQVKIYNPKNGKVECVSNCYCSRNYCAEPTFQICTDRYNTCYLNCGGTVLATTQCVQNCEEALPPSTQKLSGALTDK